MENQLKIIDFYDFQRFFLKSGCQFHPPSKLCASLPHSMRGRLTGVTATRVYAKHLRAFAPEKGSELSVAHFRRLYFRRCASSVAPSREKADEAAKEKHAVATMMSQFCVLLTMDPARPMRGTIAAGFPDSRVGWRLEGPTCREF